MTSSRTWPGPAVPTDELPPDVQYVYAKWLARRGDLPPTERRKRAEEALVELTSEGNRFRLPSLYFLGSLRVQAGDYNGALERFRQVTATQPKNEREKRIVELGHLGIGRLLVETGKVPEAIDAVPGHRPGLPQLPRGALRDGLGQGPHRGLGRRP